MIRKILIALGFSFAIAFSASAAVVSQIAVWDGTTFNADSIVTDPAPLSFTAPLIQTPGNYTYNGSVYQVPEGLTLIFATDGGTYNDGGYRYAYAGDHQKLYKSLMWLFESGPRDNALTIAQAESTIRLRKLAMTCGNTSVIVQDILAHLPTPIQSRIVHFLTAQTPNGFDDGHTALEINEGGVWQFYDFDLKNRFDLPGGGYANVDQIIDTGEANLTVEEMVPVIYYEDDYNATKFRYGVYEHLTIETSAQRAAWRAKTYQIAGIDYAGGTVLGVTYPAGTYFFLTTATAGRSSYVTGLSPTYHVVSRAIFDAMFY